MSGGVDSSVSALLLKQKGPSSPFLFLISPGYNIQGIFMRNWDEKDELGVCHADKEFEEVQRVCDRLNIPCREVNFVKDYWNEVFRFVSYLFSVHHV